MRLLLDTHIFLWCVNNDKQLSKAARSQIQNADEVYISSASIWEAVIKNRLEKLNVNIDELISAISLSGFLELPITVTHAAFVNQLPPIHRDPFDRMLIAQALSEPLQFLTADKTISEYSDLIHVI